MADSKTATPAATKAAGKIVQCIGAVIDVEFARDQMPHIYDALRMAFVQSFLCLLQQTRV